MPIQSREDMTPREVIQHGWEVDMFTMQSEHTLKVKELQLQQSKVDSRIGALLRIPLLIVMLPVKILAIIPVTVYAVRGKDIPEALLALIK